MQIYISLLVAIIAAIVYLISANPKIMALALWTYGAGVFVFLWELGGGRISLLGK